MTETENPQNENSPDKEDKVVELPGRDKFMSGIKAESLLRKVSQQLREDNKKAVESLFGQYSKETSKAILDSTNAVIQKLDNKYKQMFGFLVNKALNEMESRLHGCEIAIDAMIEVISSRLMALYNSGSESEQITLDKIMDDFKSDIEKVGKRIMQEREEERKKREAEAHAKAVAAAEAKKKEAEDAKGTDAEQSEAKPENNDSNG